MIRRTKVLFPAVLALCAPLIAIAAESLPRAYLERAAETGFKGSTPRHGLDREIARLALDRPIDPNVFNASLEFIATGKDTVDFAMTPLVRILYLYPRYRSPFVNTPRGHLVLHITAGKISQDLDFRELESIPLHAKNVE